VVPFFISGSITAVHQRDMLRKSSFALLGRVLPRRRLKRT
jgi:hypothetical protein